MMRFSPKRHRAIDGLLRLWKFSWIFTLIFLLFTGPLIYKILNTYKEIGIRYASNIRLYDVARIEFSHFFKRLSTDLYHSPKILKRSLPSSAQAALPTIDLFVPESHLNQLNVNLPHSGHTYGPGRLLHKGKFLKVKVRYRGDNLYHYANPKKSLRIKTKKKSLYQGMRRFNLIAPLHRNIKNILCYKIADLFELMTPRREMVRLNLNGRYMGLYGLVEQPREILLRFQKRMPGDLYAGESIGKDFHLPEIFNGLFLFPSIWDKRAINNHYPPDHAAPLERLITLIMEKDTQKGHDQLEQLLDMEVWGRFSAFETLSQTIHYDDRHNWRLYYDPVKNKFEPLIWDPAGMYHPYHLAKVHAPIMDVISSPLHLKLHHNATFLNAKHKAIRDFFAAGKDARFKLYLNDLITQLMPEIEKDPNLASLTRFEWEPDGTATAYRAMFTELQHAVDQVFTTINRTFVKTPGGGTYSLIESDSPTIALSIAGHIPVSEIRLTFIEQLARPMQAQIAYFRNNKRYATDISAFMRLNGPECLLKTPLFAQIQIAFDHYLKAGIPIPDFNTTAGYYELRLDGIPSCDLLQSVSIRQGDQEIRLTKVAHLKPKELTDMYSLFKSPPLPTHWEKDRIIRGVQTIEGDLMIQPGVTIRLEPAAGVIVKGVLTAIGTPTAPIRFIRLQAAQDPWGAFVLSGKKAAGSRLNYCEFEGGSGIKTDLHEYTAMLSIHDVPDVAIHFCRFRQNFRTDDMLHAAYAQLQLTDSIFEEAHSDAIDLDISSATLERCRFTKSGNDAIDLMTSDVRIFDSIMIGSGDKGISVGEKSRLIAVNNQFENNVIGVQAKDGSVATLYQATFRQNGVALDAYFKNWQYETGGEIFLYKGLFGANPSAITCGKRSAITLHDSFLNRSARLSLLSKKFARKIHLDNTVDDIDPRNAREGRLWRFPAEKRMMGDFDFPADRVNPKIRGAIFPNTDAPPPLEQPVD